MKSTKNAQPSPPAASVGAPSAAQKGNPPANVENTRSPQLSSQVSVNGSPSLAQGRKSRGTDRTTLFAEIAAARSTFQAAVALASSSNEPLGKAEEALAARILGEKTGMESFAQLEADAADGMISSETILARANALAAQRIYVLPAKVLALEARALYLELSEWQIPNKILDNIKQLIEKELESTSSDPLRARMAFTSIQDDYNYWDGYVDWFFQKLGQATIVLAAMFLISISSTFLFLYYRHPIPAFFVAGAAGALVSVMTRLPTMSVYGEVVSLFLRMATRVLSGVAGSAIGLGIIATGVLNIPLKDGDKPISLISVINHCAQHKGLRGATGATASGVPGIDRKTGRIEEGQNVADLGVDGGSGATAEANASPPPTALKGIEECADDCPAGSMAVLIALGLLLGFSERALGSIEQTVFGGVDKASEKPKGA